MSDDPQFFIRPTGGDFRQVTEEEWHAAGPGHAGSCGAACSEGHTYERGCAQFTGNTCVWPDCLTDGQQAELAAQVDASIRGEETTVGPDQRLVCGCDEAPRPDDASQSRTTPDNPVAADELTAEEARELADQLGLELYQAQDAVAFVEECCVIADREGRPVTTAFVRQWLQGPKCARQMAAGVPALPDRAQAAIRELQRQVEVRDRQLAAIQRYVQAGDEDGIRTRERVLRIIKKAGGEATP